MAITLNEKTNLEHVGEGVSRKVLSYNNNIMVVEVCFEKGAVGAVHTHPHQQICYVAEGEFEFIYNDKVTVIKAGDSYLVEANEPHGVVALTKGKLIDFFTPMREDFIKS
jgi:quercetin dioxygenase-like cupin family protein